MKEDMVVVRNRDKSFSVYTDKDEQKLFTTCDVDLAMKYVENNGKFPKKSTGPGGKVHKHDPVLYTANDYIHKTGILTNFGPL